MRKLISNIIDQFISIVTLTIIIVSAIALVTCFIGMCLTI
uniref:Uncharacterized protein n=1 Tax=Phage sp. ctL4h4 TaxID=2828005 RepID=A0A8S5TFL4_9VIRU|nr:MAG TPA: hypothetical protein [Phage sp. ctL4h4]